MPLSTSANTIFLFLLGLTFGLTIGIFTGAAHQNALSPYSSEGEQRLLEFQSTESTELRRKVSIVTELQNYLDEFRGRPSLPFPLPSLPSPYYPFSAPVTLSTTAVPKVFGLGLSKTGTTSLKEALRLLGIDCYKDTNLMNDILQQTFAEEPDEPYSVDIVRRYDDKASVTDLPLPYFFEEVAHLYPDAKFILTVREPASWWLSFKAHMERNDKSRTSQVRNALRALHYGGEKPSQYVAVKSFLRHNKLVQAIIPPERLLVLDIMKESDESLFRRLCEFVGVAATECPSDQEFPHANKIPGKEEAWTEIQRSTDRAAFFCAITAAAEFCLRERLLLLLKPPAPSFRLTFSIDRSITEQQPSTSRQGNKLSTESPSISFLINA